MAVKLKNSFVVGALIAGAATVATVGCGSPDTFDRKKMLADTTGQVFLSTHETLSERAGALDEAVSDFCEGDRSGDQLETAREQWRELQEPLKHIQAWSFNMSPYRGSSFDINVYKIDREPSWGDNIEAVIDGDKRYRRDLRVDGDEKPDHPFPDGGDRTIDVEFIENQDYRRSALGYPAVEYLLFGESDGEGMKQLYAGDDESADRRCDYLLAANEHARGTVDAYTEAWSREGGDFASTFESETQDNSDWRTVQDSVNAMVSQMVFIAKQRLSKNLLGGPLGQHADDPHVPNSVSSPHAEASIAQLRETLNGLELLYSGPEGESLADYAKFRKESVHETVVDRIDEAKSAIDAIPDPLSEAVESDTESVEAAQSAVDSLAEVIEADLKTTLGASTTRVVVDND